MLDGVFSGQYLVRVHVLEYGTGPFNVRSVCVACSSLTFKVDKDIHFRHEREVGKVKTEKNESRV